MKRWELAKQKGLNWQVVLIQDCETDIKVVTLESIRLGDDYNTTNKKVTKLINDCVKELESTTLKDMCKDTLSRYASRVYLQWINVYGTRKLGVAVLAILKAKGITPTPKFEEQVKRLPNASTLTDLPDYVYGRQGQTDIYNKEHEKKVLERVNQLLDTSAKEDYSARYSLRASAERQIRYEWQQNQMQKLLESGIDLVWIDAHANCSERCQPWQGKLYSISGKSGTIDGISYQPLSNATDRYETTKAGKTYINGTLTGFNCRHTTTPYKKGNKPNYIPADVIERQREVEKKQRELERTIRKYESRYLGYKAIRETALTKKEKVLANNMCKQNKDLVKKWTEEYISFSNKNNVAYFPSRLKV